MEVFLTRQSDEDTAYPGQWHCQGSIIRPKEKDGHVFVRLSRDEFGVKIIKSKFVAMLSHPGEVRGHFIFLIYRVQLADEPKTGKWFPVNDLPSNIVYPHRCYIIPMAVGDKEFKRMMEVKVKTLEL